MPLLYGFGNMPFGNPRVMQRFQDAEVRDAVEDFAIPVAAHLRRHFLAHLRLRWQAAVGRVGDQRGLRRDAGLFDPVAHAELLLLFFLVIPLVLRLYGLVPLRQLLRRELQAVAINRRAARAART